MWIFKFFILFTSLAFHWKIAFLFDTHFKKIYNSITINDFILKVKYNFYIILFL